MSSTGIFIKKNLIYGYLHECNAFFSIREQRISTSAFIIIVYEQGLFQRIWTWIRMNMDWNWILRNITRPKGVSLSIDLISDGKNTTTNNKNNNEGTKSRRQF